MLEPLPDSNPKTRYGVRKPSFGAIPVTALIPLGQAMAEGARKYGLVNYREKPVSSSVYYNAAIRHFLSWWDGEEFDRETGISHLGHAMACLAIIYDAQQQGTLNDDRPPVPGQFATLIARLTVPDDPPQEDPEPTTHCETVSFFAMDPAEVETQEQPTEQEEPSGQLPTPSSVRICHEQVKAPELPNPATDPEAFDAVLPATTMREMLENNVSPAEIAQIVGRFLLADRQRNLAKLVVAKRQIGQDRLHEMTPAERDRLAFMVRCWSAGTEGSASALDAAFWRLVSGES